MSSSLDEPSFINDARLVAIDYAKDNRSSRFHSGMRAAQGPTLVSAARVATSSFIDATLQTCFGSCFTPEIAE